MFTSFITHTYTHKRGQGMGEEVEKSNAELSKSELFFFFGSFLKLLANHCFV